MNFAYFLTLDGAALSNDGAHRGTVEEKIDALVENRSDPFNNVMEGAEGSLLAGVGNDKLLRAISLVVQRAMNA
jgi:hypothetical protein